MNVVITGGTGFIGSHLSIMHEARGDTVVIIDNLSTSYLSSDLGNKEFIHFDLSSDDYKRTIEPVLESADLVYHMASSVGVKYVDNDPKGTLRNSFNINNNLFPLFEKYNNRVVFASTSEVYGDTTEAREADTLKIGSTDTLRWGYACGKLMSEFLLKTYDCRSTVVRFFNVTGPGQLPDHGMVMPTFIKGIKENKDLIVYGDGLQSRTFCDIRDATTALDMISGVEHIGETYNIGNPENNITIKSLAEKVINMTSATSKIIYRDYHTDFSDNHGEIYERKPNIDKLSRYYIPCFSIQDIIESMK